jgi:Ca-activated chloride channel family protein
MNIDAILDLDVVAVESEDKVTVLLDLAAPVVSPAEPRARSAVQVVLDRSGSMAGDRLQAALDAVDALVTRLDPQDAFGLVAFDDAVAITVPSGPLRDKAAVRAAIRAVTPGGMTNLSGGYLRGLQEAQRSANGAGATLVLLSDGHANVGVTDHDTLGGLAAGARRQGVSTSTIGLGLDYDEALLAAVARGGAGDAHFAEDGDAAGAALAGEVDGLLHRVAQAASLIIRPTGDVAGVALFNDLDVTTVEGGLMIELGDFFSGEERRLLFELHVPAAAALGLAQIAELELRWVEVPSLTTKTVTLPVNVNVVPGDQAAGRIANPVVTSERAFQDAQKAKRQATDALRRGDIQAAHHCFADAAMALPPEHADEAAVLHDLADRALHDDTRRAAKLSEADMHRKNRRRGR